MKQQLELKNAELTARMSEYLPETEEGDEMAMSMFMPIVEKFTNSLMSSHNLAGNPQKSADKPPQTSSESVPARPIITDEQFRAIKNDLPRGVRKFAAKASDETLKTFMRKEIPDLTEDELKRGIAIARE